MPTLRLVPKVPSVAPGRPPVERLWREVVGDLLRERRTGRSERLVDTAARAGVSPQYLSEVERGLKDPSSEVLAAVAGALDLTLVDLTALVTRELAPDALGSTVAGPAAPSSSGPVLLAA